MASMNAGLAMVVGGMLMTIYPLSVIMVGDVDMSIALTSAITMIASSWVTIGGTMLMCKPSNPFYRAWNMVLDSTTLEYKDGIMEHKDGCRDWVMQISECADRQRVNMPDYTYLIYRYLLMNDIYIDTNRVSDLQYENLLPALEQVYPDTRWQ